MSSYFHAVRFAVVWLLVILAGRLIIGASVPYEQGTHFFSLVTFSYLAALFFGAFSRRLWGFRWSQAMLLGAAIAVSAQILVILATLGSYLLGAETYFNHPTALNVEGPIPLGRALVVRLFGLVVNTIVASIIALIGWAMGKLVPERVSA